MDRYLWKQAEKKAGRDGTLGKVAVQRIRRFEGRHRYEQQTLPVRELPCRRCRRCLLIAPPLPTVARGSGGLVLLEERPRAPDGFSAVQ